MFRKGVLIVAVLLLWPVCGAGAAEIIVVTENVDRDLDGVADDQGLIDWLVVEGHSVDVQRDHWMTLNEEKVARLNAADLILVSRTTDSGLYDDGDEPVQWNAVTTPILMMSAFFARNTRWNWVDSGTATEYTTYLHVEAVDPGHPVFRDVPLTALDPSDPDGPGNVVQVVDPLVGSGITPLIGTDDMGNGRLIGKVVGVGLGWIAEWEAGVEFYEGCGQFAGGRRLLFCAGARGEGGSRKGEFNLTVEGRQMFRNAIAYLLGRAHIILVTEAIDWNLDGLRDDHNLETFLVDEGHQVDVRAEYWKELDPSKIAELNAADLIIVSRLTWSNHYGEGDEMTQWNSLAAPVLLMNPFLARNHRWNWVDSDYATEGTPHIHAETVDPSHPVFEGVPLTRIDPDDPANVVEMVDPLVGAGLTSFIGTSSMGSGRLIAKPVGLDMGWVAEWDTGAEFYEGADQYAGGKRMLFSAGTQQIQFFDTSTQQIRTTAQGELNLTAEGLQMFRNAIAYLLRREVAYSTFGIYRLDTGALVLSDEDMAAYVGATHEIKLNESGVAKWDSYTAESRWYEPEGLYQKDFAVRLDDKELYRGKFWSAFSSESYDGIVILEMAFPREGALGVVQIQYGYPWSWGESADDPRDNPEILEFFAGKGLLEETEIRIWR